MHIVLVAVMTAFAVSIFPQARLFSPHLVSFFFLPHAILYDHCFLEVTVYVIYACVPSTKQWQFVNQ